jgi:ABC-type transport system substrate-binding protein/tetratricopeptide (TPR) repeat protein
MTLSHWTYCFATHGRPSLVGLKVWLLALGLMLPLSAQDEITVEEGPLIDQRPFDLIHLTAEAGGSEHKVMPIPFPKRTKPKDPAPGDKIKVVLMQFPERVYEIAWRNISKIDLYEDLIINDAMSKLKDNDFIGAFQNLSFMLRNYPSYPDLVKLQQEFLWKSLSTSFQGGQLEQTLSGLEELRRIAPTFRERDVTNALNRVAQGMIERYEKSGNLPAARVLLNRLNSQYGEIDVVKEWLQKIEDQANAKQAEAEEFFRQKRYRDAQRAASISLKMFPTQTASRELLAEIDRVYPLVRVGVMQRCGENQDPSSLTDWAARRAGMLSRQPLFQFKETGTEGGNYSFALGNFRLSDERDQLVLNIESKNQNTLDALGLAQTLVDRANPESSVYDPSWAAIFSSVEATGTGQLTVNLQRPNVLPHALMQWVMPHDPSQPGALPGLYSPPQLFEDEASFKLRTGQNAPGVPLEIIEKFYADPKEAVSDFLRGDLDIIDQLYPADARSLAVESKVKSLKYALPSTHMMIPISDHPFLVKEKFRRALMYATNRAEILQGELLNSIDPQEGRLISGPFPIGIQDADPLAYAYDSNIQPIKYNAQLAKLLVLMVDKELETAAIKQKKTKPELTKLVVGCPDFEFARVAVQAMIQQWAIVGVPAETRILPPSPSRDELQGVDLIYFVTTMWEPATDIERLLGGKGIATSDNPFVVQSLERIRKAKNWREIRTAMQEMHALINYHLPLLPLWQVTDRFAVRDRIDGINDRPISLYQNIRNWRINSSSSGR